MAMKKMQKIYRRKHLKVKKHQHQIIKNKSKYPMILTKVKGMKNLKTENKNVKELPKEIVYNRNENMVKLMIYHRKSIVKTN